MHGLRLALGLLPFLLSMALNTAGDNSGDGEDSDNTGDTPGNKGGESEPTFTQADIDRIVGRERKKLADSVRDEVRKEIEEEAKRKADEEAGQFKPLYEQTKAEKEAAEAKVTEVAEGFRRRLAKVEIEKAANEARLAAPKLAYRLIDFEKVTFNEEDEPTNITDLVKQLATDQPDLVKPVDNRGGSNPVPRGNHVAVTRDDHKNKYLKQAGVEV